jgi:allantoinase
VSAETCPHYLVFTSEAIPEGATAFKCAPPIREPANRERLWGGLRDGTIQQVVTDHSPASPSLKCVESGDFVRAWGGIASLQLGLAAVWTEARGRGASVADVVRWMCEAPAELVGLEGSKGRIAAGYDADLVVWRPDAEFRVEAARLEHRHKLTPYAGRKLSGEVVSTYLAGRRVFHGGAFEGEPSGEWVR